MSNASDVISQLRTYALQQEHLDRLLPPSGRAQILDDIVRSERVPSTTAGRERRRFGSKTVRVLTATAVLSLAALAIGTLTSTPRAAAADLTFTAARDGGVDAVIHDPYATQASLNEAFRARGFAITVSLIPASPSVVGTVIGGDEVPGTSEITLLHERNACTTASGADCVIGIHVPASFHGRAGIWIGRPAKPGEVYETTNAATAPGEALHCTGILGASIEKAMAILTSQRLTARWDTAGATDVDPSTLTGNVVESADPLSVDRVILHTSPAANFHVTPARVC